LKSADESGNIVKTANLTAGGGMQKIVQERKDSPGLLEWQQEEGDTRVNMHPLTEEIFEPAREEKAAEESAARARKRTGSRRRARAGLAPRWGWSRRWARIATACLGIAVLVLLALGVWKAKTMLLHNPRFRLSSDNDIQVVGNRIVAPTEILAVFAPDLGHSVFRVPLATRQSELDEIRWVRSATVMRLWPDRIRVRVQERAPIAFAIDDGAVRLVDDQGVLLDLPQDGARHYSFPVIVGLSSDQTLADRASRIDLYERFLKALDAEGGNISATLSQVDLSDTEDVRAVFSGGPAQPIVHFGTSLFLPRYRAYKAHLAEWAKMYPHLKSVDMRYGKQVVLDVGSGGGTTDGNSSKPSESTKSSSGSSTTQKQGAAERSGQRAGGTARGSRNSHGR
jgi:cell division protein FtsQ